MLSKEEIRDLLKLPPELYRMWIEENNIDVVKKWAKPRLDAFSYQQMCRYLMKTSGRYLPLIHDDLELT